jgi:hypothetical protein
MLWHRLRELTWAPSSDGLRSFFAPRSEPRTSRHVTQQRTNGIVPIRRAKAALAQAQLGPHLQPWGRWRKLSHRLLSYAARQKAFLLLLISIKCSNVHRRVRRTLAIIHFRGARVLPRYPSAMTSLRFRNVVATAGIYRRRGRCGSPRKVPALAPRFGEYPPTRNEL